MLGVCFMDIRNLIKNSNSGLKSIVGSGIKNSQLAKESDAGAKE